MSTPSAAGIWLGTLDAGSIKLRLQFHLDPDAGSGSLGSLDQGAKGIACTELRAIGACDNPGSTKLLDHGAHMPGGLEAVQAGVLADRNRNQRRSVA
jgi:hypothetical protein